MRERANGCTDKIKMTLSTMLPCDGVLQQQYRAKSFEVYSKLIHTLSQAEKHDELLMKNHHKHLIGSAPLLEWTRSKEHLWSTQTQYKAKT